MNYDIFDEKYYLSQYAWLKPAIDAGSIKSGREHFEKVGQAGGLTAVSRYFDEQNYLAQNPDCSLNPQLKQSKRTFCLWFRPFYSVWLRTRPHASIT